DRRLPSEIKNAGIPLSDSISVLVSASGNLGWILFTVKSNVVRTRPDFLYRSNCRFTSIAIKKNQTNSVFRIFCARVFRRLDTSSQKRPALSSFSRRRKTTRSVDNQRTFQENKNRTL